MKIAVATDDFENISGHIGRCTAFLVFTVKNGKITEKETRMNDFTNHHGGHGHGNGRKHGHQRLAEGLKDCEYLVSHGCGWRLKENLESQNIILFFTDMSNAEEAAIKLEQGELENKNEMVCNSH
ncbi:MAG: NifB/NifX family molybdenum-iron cluster-binding protein [Ignavibacteria bacterium]|jgi:predicted Fe-Mo cluster-binding NifX family protein